MQDPFSQAEIIPDTQTLPNSPADSTTSKVVYVPEKPQFILGIEAKTFFGMFYGALIITIFFSLMEAD